MSIAVGRSTIPQQSSEFPNATALAISIMSSPMLPWQRFWCPLGAAINCGNEGLGFLSDPEGDFGEITNPNVAPLEKLLPQSGPIILCGEPGIGKTTEIQSIRGKLEGTAGELCAWLPFREIADMADFRRRTIESSRWQVWRLGTGRLTLVVDGVDEGLLRIPNFLNDLISLLRGEPRERMRLILTCRTAEWPIETGRVLLSLWPAGERDPVYELCPLRRVDAETAARARQRDPEAFLDAVWNRHAVGLAARPITLFFLLAEYSQHSGLPATHRELYERGTINLAREVDPARAEILRALRKTTSHVSDEDRLRGAQRLAALLLLCGRSAVKRLGKLFEPETGFDLAVEAAEQTASPPVNAAALDEALESALFTSLGERRFGFAHQTFAECLAAQDIRRLPLVQLRRLLCRRDGRGEHVIPQLAELAAWVAGIHLPFCEHLLNIEPEILLRSDVMRLQGSFKARLVEAILIGAREERVFDHSGFERFISGLSHPSLGTQLLPWISTSIEHRIARRIAFSIAGSCRVTDLIDPLAAIVVDSTEAQWARERAMDALENIIPDERLTILEPFARGEAKDDPDDSIKGTALRRLVPKYWKVRDALPFLTPRKNSNYMGTYAMFLHHDLPRAIEDADLPKVLSWLRPAENFGRSRSIGRELGEAAFSRALNLLHVPAIASEVAETWNAWASRYELHQLPQKSKIRTILTENEAVRRNLTTLVLNHPATTPEHVSCLREPIPLLQGAASLEWLLEQIAHTAAESRAQWAAAVAMLSYDFQLLAKCWDKLLNAIEKIPELGAQFEWLRAWNLDEPRALEAKKLWQQDQKRRADFELSREQDAPNSKQGIADAFHAFSQGDHRAWGHLWYNLILGKNGEENWAICDLTTCDNWSLLTPAQQQSASEIARAYLFSDVSKEVHGDQMSGRELAAASAIWLLRDTLGSDVSLRAVVIESWLPVLAWHLDPDPEPRRALFALGYRLAPLEMREELSRHAARDAKKHRHPFAFRIAQDCWDADLSAAVIHLVNSSTDPQVVLNGLKQLVERDSDAALNYAAGVLGSVGPNASSYPIHLLGALVVGLVYGAARIWPAAEPLLTSDPELAPIVLARTSSHLDLEERKTLEQLPEAILAGMCILLYRHFPRTSDPPRESRGADSTRILRNRIPGFIAARGTEDACRELARLVNSLPEERTWLRWTLQEAVTNMRRNTWVRPAPNEVKALLESPKSRLLTCDEDLMDLILESLTRLQKRLTGQLNPAAEDLWTWSKAGLKRSDFRPKDEESLSDYVARWLADDLGPSAGVIANREVQPRRGSRTDIMVDAIVPGSTSEFDRITVVIEVKGCWHSAVRTGLRTQLVEGYLEQHKLRCGIYLVGWFVCPQWNDAVNSLQSAIALDATVELAGLASEFDGVRSIFQVRSFLLDCTLPSAKSPSA